MQSIDPQPGPAGQDEAASHMGYGASIAFLVLLFAAGVCFSIIA